MKAQNVILVASVLAIADLSARRFVEIGRAHV